MRAIAARHDSRPEVAAALRRSREIPRVGACTLEVSLPIELPDAHSVQLTWPAIGVDVDVIFLVHDGPLSARVRDRIAAGPAEFVLVPRAAEIAAAWESLDPEVIERARARSLWQALAALGIAVPAAQSSGEKAASCSVSVVGPVAEDRERVAMQLHDAGFTLVASPAADVVVAVAPTTGWGAADFTQLDCVFAQVGRVVATAPVPRQVCPEVWVVTEENLTDAVSRCVALPPLAPLPTAVPGAWEKGAARLERVGGHAGWVAPLSDALVITAITFVGFSRLIQVELAMIFAVIVGTIRAWVRLRVGGGASSAVGAPRDSRPGAWVRRKLAGQVRG
ncbi:hypothetical protein J5O04_00420 [Corynebacterium hindlerae]|uniref:hypothetical protein n=1 Tax=Corynebacterium hindlerae TaxID=699041 RepID=UPI001AD7C5B8|nr:hypothetical protein [Corynebacterium hindlerae]QTH59653.1 hypothetical protein J5O04_00420 [Corynebacterium hindlerae]